MKKGFTLIELLIVIGILAILATVVVIVLNPAQLFAQARDSQRISDMTTLRSAISLYLATVGNPSLGSCPLSVASGGGRCTAAGTSPFITASTTCGAVSTVRTTGGLGWVDVNLASVPGGSPLAVLPLDPINNTTNFYAYACDNSARTFELDANMESERYASGGTDDVETKDGGNQVDWYEVGTYIAW
jgi:prepilin-type N-terminal cleavage/methylation domain-containing protein